MSEEYFIDKNLELFKRIQDAFFNNIKRRLVFGDENLIFDNINLDEECLSYTMIDLSFYYKSKSEIAVRSFALNLIAEVSHTIKEKTSLFTISGYLNNDVNHYCSGILFDDGRFIDFFKAEVFFKNDLFFIKAKLDYKIMEAVDYFFNSCKLKNSSMTINQIGRIVLSNDGLTTRKIKDLFPHLSFIISSKNTTKEKFDDLEEKGAIFILLITDKSLKNNKIRVKNVCFNVIDEIEVEELDAYINEQYKRVNDLLHKQSMNIYYQIVHKENKYKKYICEKEKIEDIIDLKHQIILRPFNQRLHDKKCDYCIEDATKEILILQIS